MKRLYVGLLLLGAIILLPKKTQAQWKEHEIKGGWVYHFARYVTWPEDVFKKNVIVLGILGDDPFRGVLDELVANRKAGGRTIEIRRGNTIRELKGSHILFVGRSEEYRMNETLGEILKYRSYGVLTIGDGIEGFCEKGGIINFNRERPTFNINMQAATEAGLYFDPKLWKMAEQIIPNNPNPPKGPGK
ncbi:YfiR family protein [Flammeovirgaceae bacterium SG7u.111]|nr:YfiR family protein [Flammeovirgaceae bacterium SG7u.132]WPO35275.1 YfiR family protein [Flammeovirgaceae bacterium SG7u.111]